MLHDFASIRDFEERQQARFFWIGFGGYWFIPNSVTPSMITRAAQTLMDPSFDGPQIRVALYELWLCTKHEKMSEDDRDAMLSIYVKRLSEYPAEAVRLVIDKLVQEARFWPAWADLQKQLEALTGLRSGLINALRRAATRQGRMP